MVKNFSSHTEQCATLKDVYDALVKHSKLNHCMLKGKIKNPLFDEPRKGATTTSDDTQYLLLDLDDGPWAGHEAFIAAYPVLKDVSYVVQQSSSHGFSTKKGLSCHIFILLDKPINATLIKPWLLFLNLKTVETRAAITLSNSCTALHWPIDLTTCQNDKLIYIAPPVLLSKELKARYNEKERIQYIAKKNNTLSTNIFSNINGEALRKEERTLINELRAKIGYETLSKATTWVGESEVQHKPGLIPITGIRIGDEYTTLNLNGGDSWGYFHPNNDFELIRNFKGELALFTKQINPDYYRECLQARDSVNAAPTTNGDIILAFRDPVPDKYYNGTWNPEKFELNLYKAGDIQKLRDYIAAYGGQDFGDHVPLWELHFTPSSNEVYDAEKKRINTFVASTYLRAEYTVPKSPLGKSWPTIYKVLHSAVAGAEISEEGEKLFEHLLNWLAVIAQYRVKTDTAWLFSGIEGTGKSMVTDHIMAPILGRQYTLSKPANTLEDTFNAWVTTAILVFIDEIDIKSSPKSRSIVDDLKNKITSSIGNVRAMHTDSRQAVNFLNFIFSSNRMDPIELSENERRYNVGIFQTKKLEMTSHEVDVLIPQELEAFAQYLMTRVADRQVARTVLDSSTRRLIIENSRSSLDEISMNITMGQLDKLAENCVDLTVTNEIRGADAVGMAANAFTALIKREVALCEAHKNGPPPNTQRYKEYKPGKNSVQVYSKLSREDLSIIFQHSAGVSTTPAKFTKLLSHRGINISPMRINEVMVRGCNVSWEISKTALEILVEQHKPKLASVTNIKKAKVM